MPGRDRLCRRESSSDYPVEFFLARLVDDAHAALAQEFQDLQVGEMGAQLRGGWRHKLLRRQRTATVVRSGLGVEP